MKVKKKKKHILSFFQSNSKKFKFYYKPRNFYDNKKNLKNNFTKINNEFYLLSLNSTFLKINPILACVKMIKQLLKQFLLNSTVLSILIFPDFQLTSKPKEVRMGRGKGSPSIKIVLLKKNTFLFSLFPINSFYAFYILNQCRNRLPVKSKIIYRYW